MYEQENLPNVSSSIWAQRRIFVCLVHMHMHADLTQVRFLDFMINLQGWTMLICVYGSNPCISPRTYAFQNITISFKREEDVV
jgi:hypothetical protein